MEGVRKQLKGSAQKLSLGLLWRELQVFSKLLFRGRNQHRRDKSYQRLLRISKDLKRYQEAAVANHLKKLFKSVQTLTINSPLVETQATAVVTKLVDCGMFTNQLLQFIEVTFIEVHQRFTMNLFIPFNLLMLSSLSRMWYCLRYHLLSLSEVYLTIISELLIDSKHKFKPSLWDHLDKEHNIGRESKPPTPTKRSLGTLIPRSIRGVSEGGDEMCSVSTSLPPSEVPLDLNPPPASVDQDRSDFIPTLSEHYNIDARTTADILDMATHSHKEFVLPTKASHKNKRKKRQANTLALVVRCGRRLVKLNVRNRKLLKLLNQAYKDKQGNCSLKVHHIKLGSLGTVPVGVPRQRSSGFRLKILVLTHKEDKSKPSKGTTVASNKNFLSTVKKLQHRFEKELEKAAASPEKRLKRIHHSKTNNVTCDEIDDIFSILDK